MSVDVSKLPYSPWREASGLVFVSGQIGLSGSRLVEGGVEAQVLQALKNMTEVLKQAGLNPSDIVKVTVFLRYMKDFETFNEVYAAFLEPYLKPYGMPYPARTTVSPGLPISALFEIEAIAARRVEGVDPDRSSPAD